MKKIVLVAFLTLLSVNSFGQTTPEELINSFFKEYSKNTNKALDDLYATNPWTSRIKDGIEKIKKDVNGFIVDYVGKYYGYEPITKKQFSDSFVLYSYLVKYERQPMRFTFEFYKPNDKWILYSFKYDTEFDDEIEQAAKLYYLDLDKK
ncbi:MAG: hypothetical protein SFU91_13400 [Chloroherpetonaceae bacterium]|nr:hypothetical protein [Chloroherpetonaceae bacterium]